MEVVFSAEEKSYGTFYQGVEPIMGLDAQLVGHYVIIPFVPYSTVKTGMRQVF